MRPRCRIHLCDIQYISDPSLRCRRKVCLGLAAMTQARLFILFCFILFYFILSYSNACSDRRLLTFPPATRLDLRTLDGSHGTRRETQGGYASIAPAPFNFADGAIP